MIEEATMMTSFAITPFEHTLWLIFDATLALLVLALGWLVVSSRDLKRAVVLFIAFGLLLALIWARLAAPDLALAEAAIGAGLTGALLLTALRRRADTHDHPVTAGHGWPRPVRLLSALLTVLMVLVIGWALFIASPLQLPGPAQNPVYQQLIHSGVSNPVTAVLLNFRAWDTLLELAVLLSVATGILALGSEQRPHACAGPLLRLLLRALVPLLVLMAGYLLWVGAYAPGGAFQAGAVLAAAGILLHLGGRHPLASPSFIWLRLLLVTGVGLFLLVGLLPGKGFLVYPQAWAGTLILLIESAALISIATTLMLAYRGGDRGGC